MLNQSTPLSRTVLRQALRTRLSQRAFTQCAPARQTEGRKPDEHVNNLTDNLNVQADSSKAGKEDRAAGNEQQQAAAQKDSGNNNERAQKDHPEAPGPVIGMNDERGGKGH